MWPAHDWGIMPKSIAVFVEITDQFDLELFYRLLLDHMAEVGDVSRPTEDAAFNRSYAGRTINNNTPDLVLEILGEYLDKDNLPKDFKYATDLGATRGGE